MMMMMKDTTMIRLFFILVLVGLFHLICLTRAVPITRTQSLIMQIDAALAVDNNINSHNVNPKQEVVMIIRETELENTAAISAVTETERMELLELHDYPPSGANGHHTPKPPYP
ncbi:hypothetical protein PIB30_018102 [Stylosanthes scabra]|uniref:Uncharacterized protein n=1 Tax=Stylosanthes scabra TaxID=79078 RepID=A0ABU6Z6S9_9FABA|nr:hypothetical protein [Stylosanthes scabra]